MVFVVFDKLNRVCGFFQVVLENILLQVLKRGGIVFDINIWNKHINNMVKKAGERHYMLRIQKQSNADVHTSMSIYDNDKTCL